MTSELANVFLTEDYFPTETSKDNSRRKNIQIIFNSILQNRKQLQINLSGSQITYCLNFFIDSCLDYLIEISKVEDLAFDKVQNLLIEGVGKKIIFYRRQGLTYLLENVNEIFLKIMLSNNIPEKFLILKTSSLLRNLKISLILEIIKSKLIEPNVLEYLLHEYKVFKNLVIGNFIRFAYQEVNSFFKYKDEELKLDYFSHLIVYIDKTIDKYDATKGTLSTFITNWFKDARLSFKKDNEHLFFEVKELVQEDPEESSNSSIDKNFSIQHSSLSIVEQSKTLFDIEESLILKIKEHSKLFPEINQILKQK